MTRAVIVGLTIVLLVLMSVLANRRFKTQDRLPMQWSLDGSVNWTAPRQLALAFTPVLAAIILPSTLVLKPRSGQEGVLTPSILFCSILFVGAHAFHLWLIGGSLRKKD